MNFYNGKNCSKIFDGMVKKLTNAQLLDLEYRIQEEMASRFVEELNNESRQT